MPWWLANIMNGWHGWLIAWWLDDMMNWQVGEWMTLWMDDIVNGWKGDWMAWWMDDMVNGWHRTSRWMDDMLNGWHGKRMTWCMDDMVNWWNGEWMTMWMDVMDHDGELMTWWTDDTVNGWNIVQTLCSGLVFHLFSFTMSSSSRATLFMAPAFCFFGSSAVLLRFISIIPMENRIAGLLILILVRFIISWIFVLSDWGSPAGLSLAVACGRAPVSAQLVIILLLHCTSCGCRICLPSHPYGRSCFSPHSLPLARHPLGWPCRSS